MEIAQRTISFRTGGILSGAIAQNRHGPNSLAGVGDGGHFKKSRTKGPNSLTGVGDGGRQGPQPLTGVRIDHSQIEPQILSQSGIVKVKPQDRGRGSRTTKTPR